MTGSAVIAVGGNSLIRAGEKGTVPEQIQNARCVSAGIVQLLADGFRLAITHETGLRLVPPCCAPSARPARCTSTALTYAMPRPRARSDFILQLALHGALHAAGLSRPLATVLTQVVVSGDDPAFQHPTKPIGPFYSRAASEERPAY